MFLTATNSVIVTLTPVFYINFKGQIENWFNEMVDLACSYISFTPLTNTVILTIFFIYFFKIFLKLKPNRYLQIDHEHTFIFIVINILCIQVFEQTGKYLMYGTLCRRTELDLFIYRYGISVKDKPIHTFGDAALNIFLVIVAYIIYKMITVWKNYKQMHHVLPVNEQSDQIESTSSKRPTNVNFIAFAFIVGEFNVLVNH